ncbi:MAG TPA: acetyl-CoA carboxylase carboxyltransferase subunit alpha [Vampirovibrionales bacterium]
MSTKKASHYVLEFEKPLSSLLEKVQELENAQVEGCEDVIQRLKDEFLQLRERIYSNLQPHQRLQLARHPERPSILDFITSLGTDWIELHGDRNGHDDAAIVGGILKLNGKTPIVLVGTRKGRHIKEKQKCNFGMPQPHGYQKALRLFKHAETFKMPIVTLVDTPGAYPGLEAEMQGQSRAIAMNIQEMSELTVPIISVITGEGGSGGALALAVANKVLMLEHSVYSVISPEGCAAILWRTRDKFPEAAKALQITANQLYKLGLIDEIILEPAGGAHKDYKEIGESLKNAVVHCLEELIGVNEDELRKQRKDKFRQLGVFSEM